MDETPQLSLPLLQAAQAQKHVTVNEALIRLDGLAQLVLKSVDVSVPPGLAQPGDCYAVPAGAGGVWTGQGGQVALYSNGGWLFVQPRAGWRAWIDDQTRDAVFDGVKWVGGSVAVSPGGAAMVFEIVEIDHVIGAAATSVVSSAIPGDAVVFGVTGRVLQALDGGVTGWQLGVAGSTNRYGSGLGVQAGAWLRGLTGTPVAYYAPTDLVLTAEGGVFAGGAVRLAVNLMRLSVPAT